MAAKSGTKAVITALLGDLIIADNVGIDFPVLMARKKRIVTRLSKGIETYLFKKNKITLFRGHGRLEGGRTVVVKGEQGDTKVQSKAVLIATGSRPRSLPGITLDAGILKGTRLVARPFARPAPFRTLALLARHTSSRRRDADLLADFVLEHWQPLRRSAPRKANA